MIPYILLEMEDLVGHKGEAYYVDENGVKTNISGAVQGADIRIRVGETNKVTLHTLGKIHVKAELQKVLEKMADAVEQPSDG